MAGVRDLHVPLGELLAAAGGVQHADFGRTPGAVVGAQAGARAVLGFDEHGHGPQLFGGEQVAAGIGEQVLTLVAGGLLARGLQPVVQGLGGVDPLLAFGQGGVAGQRPVAPARHEAGVVERTGAVEDAGQRVVVGGRDRVELVVVAARAAERLAEERAADQVELFVDGVEHQLRLVLFGQHARTERQEAGRRVAVDADPWFVDHQVAGDLQLREAIERQVLVVGGDDPVAIAPRIGEGEVLVEAVAVAVAGQVEPMARLAFAVVRRSQQFVDERGEGGLVRLCGEALALFGGRWQAGEHVGGTAQQGRVVGAWVGAQALLSLGRRHEAVERLLPVRIRDRRRGGCTPRRKCPWQGHGGVLTDDTASGDGQGTRSADEGEAQHGEVV